jgi:hypothetical protein
MTFEETWTAIEDSSQQALAGIVRRRVLPNSFCPLFLGIEKPSGRRVFLARAASVDIPDPTNFPKTRGVELRLGALPDDPAGFSSVMLVLNEPPFKDIFSAFTADIANHVAVAADNRTAVEQLLARLNRWQAFLERHGFEGLSETAQRGLFGELWFIRHYLIPFAGPQSVTAWTGPHLAAQDFQSRSMAVEVKTTVAKEHQKLRITGEQQLDSTVQLRIFLLHLSLNPLRDVGITLVEMIGQIRALLAVRQLSLAAFEDLLIVAGYLDCHASRYQSTGYVEREHHFFEVRNNFPRIIGQDLRPGVGDLSYSISVAECLHYVIREADLTDLLRRLRT